MSVQEATRSCSVSSQTDLHLFIDGLPENHPVGRSEDHFFKPSLLHRIFEPYLHLFAFSFVPASVFIFNSRLFRARVVANINVA